MVRIDSEKCIGCGKCVGDCFRKELELMDGKARSKDIFCMECGHCSAICPTGAISLSGYEPGEILELSDIKADIDPAVYLNHLKTRRSIRQFTEEPVTEEELNMILEAGRYSPTGGNVQDVHYFVSQKDIGTFRGMVLSKLCEMGLDARRRGDTSLWYFERWIEIYESYRSKGRDELFFDAGTVIVLSAASPQSAVIAAAHMETMIYSLGLGMLYSGFTFRAISESPELQQYLEIEEGLKAYAVLVIGRPNVSYCRTAPRKKANVIRR